jgi:O-antigen/teichoic acid export membrane protein
VAALDARGESHALRQVYLDGARMMLLAAIPLGLIAGLWSADFLLLWLGPEHAAGGAYPPPALLFCVLLPGAVCKTTQMVGHQVLLGSRRLRLMAKLLVCEGVCQLVLSVCLIQWYGLAGVAVAGLVAALTFPTLLQPLVLGEILRISPAAFFRRVWLRPLLSGASLAGTLVAFRLIVPVAGWHQLIFQGFVASLLAVVVVIALGLDPMERRALLRQLLRLAPRARLPKLKLSAAREEGYQSSVESRLAE